MKTSTLPLSFRPEGRMLKGPVPEHFEAFYRAAMRYRTGRRVRSLDVTGRYHAWAEKTGAPSMNLREIRRAMVNIGHRHFRSNITFFGDVQFIEDAGDVADNFPSVSLVGTSEGEALLKEIDGILGDLMRVRGKVAAAPASNR